VCVYNPQKKLPCNGNYPSLISQTALEKNKKSLWDPPRSKRGYLCVVGLREGDALTTRTLLLSL